MYRFLLLCLLTLPGIRAGAQIAWHGPADNIRLGAVVAGKDTLAMIYMDEFEVHDQMPKHLAKALAKRADAMSKLRYNIYKVYPYAVTAAVVLKDVDTYLDRLPDKAARKKYLKTVEEDLNKRFKGELKNLTISQGQVLVKLIDRQTGKSCFHIVKELKGGFNAFVWNGVAQLFSNNLKREYDPTGYDRDMETIVRELEERAWH